MLALLNELWVRPVTDARVNHQERAADIYRSHGERIFRSITRAADLLNRNYARYRLEKATKAEAGPYPIYDIPFIKAFAKAFTW